jgi:hypothetical protein
LVSGLAVGWKADRLCWHGSSGADDSASPLTDAGFAERRFVQAAGAALSKLAIHHYSRNLAYTEFPGPVGDARIIHVLHCDLARVARDLFDHLDRVIARLASGAEYFDSPFRCHGIVPFKR